jgi:hypothetical protein
MQKGQNEMGIPHSMHELRGKDESQESSAHNEQIWTFGKNKKSKSV